MQLNGKHLLNILVVQGDDQERESMVALLEGGNAYVHGAANGREGLRLFHGLKPEILILDLNIEQLDGLHLLEEAHETVPGIKVIVTFGSYAPYGLVQAVELGVDKFFRLPVDGSKLREAVMQCARDISMARRMVQADYSLYRLLDFFPGPAVLVDGFDVTYMNRPLRIYLGHDAAESACSLDMGVEDFILQQNNEKYDGHPHKWIESMINDPVDRDHVLHLENPRNPGSRPRVFSVTFNQFPGTEMRLFSFQDVSDIEDERVHFQGEASTDPLTKALNRRSLMEKLSRLRGTETAFGLIMFDIDHFKSVNDTYGHDVGDAVLREIAQLVRDQVRDGDVLARWGGEEFIVLSPGTGEKRAIKVAERLRLAVKHFAFTGVPRRITSSFGVVMHTPGETGDELVKRADLALYKAKETGRDKVVIG
nr:diguanylate cyclase [uncultured Pseudodesulfovibrio sp.]